MLAHDSVLVARCYRLPISSQPHRRLSSKYQVRSARTRADRRVGAWCDDADHGHRAHLLTQNIESDRRCRVACNNQELDALLLKLGGCLHRIARDRRGALGAVRQTRRISEINEILERQLGAYRLQNRETADARIENAHRPVIVALIIHGCIVPKDGQL